MRFWKKLVTGVALTAAMLSVGCTQTNPGEATTFSRLGTLEQKCYGPGLYWYNPFVTDATDFDTRLQKHTINLWPSSKDYVGYGSAGSKDLQDLYMVVTLNYKLDGKACHEVQQNLGKDFVHTLIEPATVETVKAVVGHYNAEQVITDRANLRKQVFDTLQAKFAANYITLTDVVLQNIDFNKEFAHAIEAKQIQQQVVLKAEFLRQEAVKTAESRVAAAKGEADARVLQATAEAQANRMITQSLTPEILRYQYLQKWNGELPRITGGTSTFVGADAFLREK